MAAFRISTSMFLCLDSLNLFCEGGEVDLGEVQGGRPLLSIVIPTMESSSSSLMSPITFEMSGGSGFSFVRIASARVARHFTRPANSSAAGSGFTAW